MKEILRTLVLGLLLWSALVFVGGVTLHIFIGPASISREPMAFANLALLPFSLAVAAVLVASRPRKVLGRVLLSIVFAVLLWLMVCGLLVFIS